MSSKGRNVIVVGTSAGGLEALDKLLAQLPPNLPASIFIVQHMAPGGEGDALLNRLRKYEHLRCKLASNGERFEPGRVYVAPPDYHLLIKRDVLLTTKGARENRYRPGIDPLFRSAAVTHGPRVIGVLLTGMLDDGTAGLTAIHRCGGITIVQDPEEAAYPGMPNSALASSSVDHCVRLSEMGALLDRLTRQRHGRARPIPADITTEARIAERVLSDVAEVNTLGDLVPYNCPNCGGTLWEMAGPDIRRLRCHTGHSYTAEALLGHQTDKLEETLWICLRMFEERRNLLNSMTRRGGSAGTAVAARAKETEGHIERIRSILLSKGVAESGAKQRLVLSVKRRPRAT
jgi:two-component system, chemotaxis family, protein-glutamate methylesterase/glutaminase